MGYSNGGTGVAWGDVRSISGLQKKERSGLQSACDELIDKGAIITGRIVGYMRPELGEFIP